MANETLTCAAGVTPERVSALRDEALAPDEAQRLRAHIAECAACRARMADYDALATALRQQRELEPGERIVEGVRSRLAAGAAPWRPQVSRRVWAGLATLAPVAAIILLFVYVFSGLAGRGQPATANTPTVAPTPLATNQYGKLVPTTSPGLVSLPPMTPSVSVDAAWGTLNPVGAILTSVGIGPGKIFVPTAMTADGSTLVGSTASVQTPLGGAVYTPAPLGVYDTATHQFTTLSISGGASAIDSRYIVYGYNDGNGQTCGVCHNRLWAYDRQSGATWEFDPGKQYAGDLADFVSADHVVFWTVHMQVWMADLVTHQVKLVLPIGAQPATNSTTGPTSEPDVRPIGFSWPYLIYTSTPYQPGVSAPTTSLDILNLQTNVNTRLPFGVDAAPGAPGLGDVGAALIIGDTLYLGVNTSVDGVESSGAHINTSYGTLYRASHIFSGAGQPEMLARWQEASMVPSSSGTGMSMSANDRLITLASGYVWDIAENKLVRLNAPGGTTFTTILSGPYLLLLRPLNAPNPLGGDQGSLIDTTTLPVR